MRAATAIAVIGALAPRAARADAPVFTPELQFRPRYEFDTGRDGDRDAGDVHYVTHRARLGAALDWERFGVRLVFQDVRAWGEETDTRRDFSGDGIDLAIGTFTWRPRTDLTLVLGRDEVVLHDQRLVAIAGWRQPGRHFDGGRLTFADGAWGAEVAGFVVVDDNAFDFATTDQVRPGYGDHAMGWVRGGRETPALTAQALVVLDDRQEGPNEARQRWTSGVFVSGTAGILSGRAEVYGQLGRQGGRRASIAAWMAGVLGTVAPTLPTRPTFTLGYDVLSGDEDPDDNEILAFEPLFGANHQYYGHLDIAVFQQGGPADARGLHDLFARITVDPVAPLGVRVDQHLFAPYSRVRTERLIAAETDVQLQVRAHEAVTVSAGGSVWAPLVTGDRVPEGWAWLMVDVAWRGPALTVPAPRRESGEDAAAGEDPA